MPEQERYNISLRNGKDLQDIKRRLDRIEVDLNTLLAVHKGILLFAYFSKWVVGVSAGIVAVWAFVKGGK